MDCQALGALDMVDMDVHMHGIIGYEGSDQMSRICCIAPSTPSLLYRFHAQTALVLSYLLRTCGMSLSIGYMGQWQPTAQYLALLNFQLE